MLINSIALCVHLHKEKEHRVGGEEPSRGAAKSLFLPIPALTSICLAPVSLETPFSFPLWSVTNVSVPKLFLNGVLSREGDKY